MNPTNRKLNMASAFATARRAGGGFICLLAVALILSGCGYSPNDAAFEIAEAQLVREACVGHGGVDWTQFSGSQYDKVNCIDRTQWLVTNGDVTARAIRNHFNLAADPKGTR